jgi:hypothetical protein
MSVECQCRFPDPGPWPIWDWRCRICDGTIRFLWFRWFRRQTKGVE